MQQSRHYIPETIIKTDRDDHGVSLPLSDVCPLGMLVTDGKGTCLYSNEAYQALCGLTAEEIIGSNWADVIAPEDHEATVAHWHNAVEEGGSFLCESRLMRSNGEVVWIRRNGAKLNDTLPDQGYVHTVEDISEYKVHELARRKAEDELFDAKERAQVTLDSIGDAVLSTDLSGHVSYMNVIAENLTGYTRQEAIGRPLAEIFRVVYATTHKTVVDPARRAVESDRIVALEANALLVAKDGLEVAIEDSAAPIHDRFGTVTGAVIVFHDVQYSRENAARMAYLAQHDALTGLPNRNAFTERFEQSLALARRHRTKMGLLFIDLDNFKTINDALGHDDGDQALKALASRLVGCVRSTDSVCRYGGDEFVVLLSEITHQDHAYEVVEKIRQAVTVPLMINDCGLSLELSIGVSVYPDHGGTVESLLRKADAEMYRVKMSNRLARANAQERPLRPH